MQPRSSRQLIFPGCIIALGLLMMANYILRGRDGGPSPQSSVGWEIRRGISGNQIENSAYLLNTVHHAAQNLGTGSRSVIQKVERVLAEGLREREMERIDAQAEFIRLKTLAEMKARAVQKNDSQGVGPTM